MLDHAKKKKKKKLPMTTHPKIPHFNQIPRQPNVVFPPTTHPQSPFPRTASEPRGDGDREIPPLGVAPIAPLKSIPFPPDQSFSPSRRTMAACTRDSQQPHCYDGVGVLWPARLPGKGSSSSTTPVLLKRQLQPLYSASLAVTVLLLLA